MSQQFLIDFPFESSGSTANFSKQDKLALEVLKNKNCIVPIIKVPRAGATTSLIINGINDHKKVVIIEPSHEIGQDTIKKAVHFSQYRNAKIIYFHENKQACAKLVTECQQNEKLRKAKLLLRPNNCERCEFFNDPSCELQKVLNCHDWSILVVTYQKLRALWLSRDFSKVSELQLQKILSADTLILDEYSTGLLGLTPNVELSDKRYSSLTEVILEGYDEWWEKVENVSYYALEFGKQLEAGKSDKFTNPLSDEDLRKLNNNFTGMWNKVKRLIKKNVETDFLQDMLQLVSWRDLFIQKDRKGYITLKPLEPLDLDLSFINTFADEFAVQGKLSILVDAHLPEFELQKHFKSRVEPFLWGDPNSTNETTVYLCDTRKISEEDIYHEKTREYLQKSITEICNFHKSVDRLLVICINKAMAKEVERWKNQGLIPDVKVTWYRSTITKGVQAEGYVEIMIGAPYIPQASYLHKVAKNMGVDKATAWNRAFRNSNMHAEYVNASARVKDPRGIYQSYVYCLGITRFEVTQFLNLYGPLYGTGSVKRPTIVAYPKTGMDASMWVDMTNLYQRRNEICNAEQSIPYILELTRVFTKTAGKVRLQQAFRDKSGEAKEAFLKNAEFLMSIDVYVKKQGRGLILVLNDKNPY